MYTSPTRKHIILRSSGFGSEDFSALFTRTFGGLYADAKALNTYTIEGVYGRHEGVSFRRLRFCGDLTVEFPTRYDEITFVIPTAGKVIVSHICESVGLNQVGLAVNKADVRALRFLDNHAQYGISIKRALFAERLSTLLGKPIVDNVCFAPVVDLSVAAYQGLRSLLIMATGAEFDILINAGSLMPARLQEMLVDAVLEAWPHNYTEALRRPTPSIAPRHVKLAIGYIREHPHNMVSGTELARYTNVSLRALQEGFKRFVGQSIATYQRQVRLERAYDALSHGVSPSVTEVALRYGFSNVGRFSHYFQSAYGVSPADVRKGLRIRP
ncbi:helix-turn-helix domain-containing protein [Pseudomonas sp.]|uniref:helix-turn-helix domain-containing protein n=1 Tax=Pseudomonas sp. TaxID=306 RepID=UPI003D6FE9FB